MNFKSTGLFLLSIIFGSFVAADQDEYGSGIAERIHINGEGGIAFFDTGSEGEFPNQEFRVDEAKLFFEAAVVEDIYFFAEIDLLTREEGDERLQLGELYIDFEDVGNRERAFNIRAGRFDTPFGEEYLTRDAIDNPLISHSLSDIWGVDEGVQIYGEFGQLEYAFAIQNGGEPVTRDFNSDKAIIGRVLFSAKPSFHFSVSAMRTGDLDVDGDRFSEIWFGNGFLVPLGPLNSTTLISGNLFQGDAHLNWGGGHAHFALGHMQYRDDDSTGDNSRDVNHFYVELVQNLNQSNDHPWHAAARYSRISADNGFPLVGFGDFDTFLFDDNRLTEELWRMSAGLGYRIGRNVLLKAEYSFENGTEIDGTDRDNENFFGIEAAVKF
jgi:hypothetical protein